MGRKKADLGIAIIARNAEATIRECLRTIVPYAQQVVVCVDETTTDRTARMAKHAGAEVYPVRVSHEHECPAHGKIMAQDFARARQESFSHLSDKLTWWGWIDSDDVVIGGERLAEVLAAVAPESIGVWLNYDYAGVEKNGVRASSTSFHRERLLRREVGWRWRYRVHEVVEPLRQGPWEVSEVPIIRHQGSGHDPNASARRNLTLLEIDLEENPSDTRAVFYVANQYFALSEWAAAAVWYTRYLNTGANPYERWQSALYASIAHQQEGDLQAAMQMTFTCMDENPTHPEPYIQMGNIYLKSGQFDKAVYWARMAEGRPTPPFFVFKNPLDYGYNSSLIVGEAMAHMGRITEARTALERAVTVLPEPKLLEAIEGYKQQERDIQTAEGLRQTLSMVDINQLPVVWDALSVSERVRSFGRVRDVVMPAIHDRRPSTQPRVVFYCGRGLEAWGPPSLNTTGIGGSETAVIEIARRFSRDGWRVDVYNDADRFEGVYEGVGYWDCKRFTTGAPLDLFVSWRHPEVQYSGAPSLLWCHDLNYGPDAAPLMKGFTRVLGVSAWHAQMLKRYYWTEADYVPNGINLARFGETMPPKTPWRAVWASSPDRGLLQLLNLWPRIAENEPGAELHVCYGWRVFDEMAKTRPSMVAYKDVVMRKLEETPQVVYLDRLPQDKLAELYLSASAWLYPTHFLEVSCISAMEAMAGGAVPVVTACGALRETIGDGGIVVGIPDSSFPGQHSSVPWQDVFVYTARAIMGDPQNRLARVVAGRRRASELTWDAAYLKWLDVVAPYVGEKGGERCVLSSIAVS